MIPLLFAALPAVTPGWTEVTVLEESGYPEEVWMDETGDCHVRFLENGLEHWVIYDGDGIEMGRTSAAPASADVSWTLELDEWERDYGADVILVREADGGAPMRTRIGESGDPLELSGMTCPSADGGCFALFSPHLTRGVWKLVRVNGLGEIQFTTSFTVRGGPMIGFNRMVERVDGGVLLTGTTDDLGMNLFMVFMGYSRRGESEFFHMDSLRFHGSGELLAEDDSGNIYLAGYTGYEREDGYFLPPSGTDLFLDCYSPEGDRLWRSIPDLPMENRPVCMDAAEDGSVVLVVASDEEGPYWEPVYQLLDFHPGRNPDENVTHDH